MQEIENLLLPLDPHDHPDCQTMYWMNSEISAIKEYAKKCIKPLLEEIETLRTENAQLKLSEAHLKLDINRLEALNRSFDENEKRLLAIVRNLRSENATLRSEREAMMKQKLAVFFGKMPESNGKTNWTAILYRENSDDFMGGVGDGYTLARSEYEDRVRYDADCVRYLIGEVDKKPSILDYDSDKHSGYVEPLPAQQIPDTLSPDDFVPMPSNADQASWMIALGESWLERNAPERLNPHRVGLHIDDFAVNQFADSMKKKLAISREKGKSGWNDPLSCKVSYLAELLISHLPKGDPVDVANFAMMLHLRDGGHDALKEAANKIKQIPEGYALDAKRYQWIRDNVEEKMTPDSLKPHAIEHKTMYVLPRLIAWADFCGQSTFDEAIDRAMLGVRT